MDVEIKLKQGPVRLLSGEAPVDRTVDLGNGIEGQEAFPGGRSAFYWLRLRKDAPDRKLVRQVERELEQTLHRLSHAWPFCGGSILRVAERVEELRPLYESNAEAVFEEMTRAAGLTPRSVSVSASAEIVGTYREPPLRAAAELLRATRQDPEAQRMLRNYHAVNVGEAKWWNDLYRIKDELEASYGGSSSRRVRAALEISDEDWQLFEKTLNPGLRHGGDQPPASLADLPKVRELGHAWIAAHLQRRYGLS